eukprot:c9524_g1_i1.p1 GENE.c9524_g1_i1~~c9524_g1_i1.p1  ORF type:complete len:138 (-),score=27.12 c9524_g1_i1:472-885(-)
MNAIDNALVCFSCKPNQFQKTIVLNSRDALRCSRNGTHKQHSTRKHKHTISNNDSTTNSTHNKPIVVHTRLHHTYTHTHIRTTIRNNTEYNKAHITINKHTMFTCLHAHPDFMTLCCCVLSMHRNCVARLCLQTNKK